MPLREYHRTAEDLEVTQGMIDDFREAGYIVVRKLLDTDEVNKLKKQFEGTEEFRKYIFSQTDGVHKKMKLCAWNYPGNDVSGMVVRSEKYAGTCEKLMGGEVYLYHSKVMMKDAETGGIIHWHQDYGYWYKSGNLYPDMITVFTALDPCTEENGCLQVLEGSHRCGRVDHLQKGEQQEADPERVEQLLPRLERHYVSMEPGDAIFFHCNLLHRSEANCSPQRRWAFANAFNMARNSSVVEHHHPQYNKLHKVPSSAIRECDNFTDLSGKGFLEKEKADWYDPEAEKAGENER
ncbi:L-proline trans-4-hydroxylase-like [Babylonia areolata]|uniref:L-proline trans-4-hydroxylase-like n=1 Tax=Babylonia areolata TaxID=304850 RepID=UPI003FD48AC2